MKYLTKTVLALSLVSSAACANDINTAKGAVDCALSAIPLTSYLNSEGLVRVEGKDFVNSFKHDCSVLTNPTTKKTMFLCASATNLEMPEIAFKGFICHDGEASLMLYLNK